MVNGTQNPKIPSLSVVLPYFLLSSLSLLVVSILFFLIPDSVYSHYFQAILLCITHVAVLGFITSIIFGSIYQMHSIIFEVNIYSEFLAKISFVSLATGLIFLCVSFYKFSMGVVCQTGALLVLFSFITFALNFFLAIRKSDANYLETDIISSSIIWLLVTGIVGVLLVFNFTHVFIPKSHLDILTIHAHLGFAGWVVLLIIGVSGKIIPMFYLAEKVNKQTLKIAHILINSGLIVLSVSIYWELPVAVKVLSSILLATGIVSFLYFILSAYIKRNRKKIDIGFNLTAISFLFLFATLPIGILLSFEILDPKTTISLAMVYGILFIIGFCGSIIIGQALNIIPFMVWINKYQHQAETLEVPMPKDLIPEKAALWMMVLFLTGVLGLCLFFLMKWSIGIKASALVLIAASVLYNYCIFRALFFKVKTPENSGGERI